MEPFTVSDGSLPAFEVRIPAFQRPEALGRAIRSLHAQTYPHWRAVVYDDSTTSAVQEAMQAYESGHVVYRRNPVRLGAAANIDQCFSSVPAFAGHYACLLEDDNYWLPGFLASIVDVLRARQWDTLLVNQRIHEYATGLRPAHETTRGDWFEPGVVQPLTLRASLFFMEGVSNGGLVWRLGGAVNLQVGSQVKETALHEACRSLLVGSPFLFLGDAQAVWSLEPTIRTARAQEPDRAISRGMQSIRQYLLHRHGTGIVQCARLLARSSEQLGRLVQALAYAGSPALAGELLRERKRLAALFLAKGLALRAVQPDPCAKFLSSCPSALGFA